MNFRKSLFGLLAATAIGAAACGGYNNTTTTPSGPSTTTAPATAVKVADSTFGRILVGADGKTLYGLTNDTNGQSSCDGVCAQTWPPVIVNAPLTASTGLDPAMFSTVARSDGKMQLVAGKWPLYEFAGDAKPGETNGQGSGGVWFVVGTDAKFIKAAPAPAAPAPVATQPAAASVNVAESPLGKIMVDANGRTLYAFTKDSNGSPTCTDACAKTWPAASVTGQPVAGTGIMAMLRSVAAPSGGDMIAAGKWPLYRFSGDAKPGDTNGQSTGGVWFAIAADGTLVKP